MVFKPGVHLPSQETVAELESRGSCESLERGVGVAGGGERVVMTVGIGTRKGEEPLHLTSWPAAVRAELAHGRTITAALGSLSSLSSVCSFGKAPCVS